MASEASAFISGNHAHKGSGDSDLSITDYREPVEEFEPEEVRYAVLNGHIFRPTAVVLQGGGQSPIQRVQSAEPRLESPRSSEPSHQEPVNVLFRVVEQTNVCIPTTSILLPLGAGALASAAVATVGVAVAGNPELIPVVAAVGGLGIYGSTAFVTRWDIPHKIAASLTLPVAMITLFPVIGPVGVAAVTLAAGEYGPELCTKVSTAVGKILHHDASRS